MFMKSISWVEDDHDVIDPCLRPLVNEGFRIEPYSTYRSAWQNRDRIRETDLLLLDLILPHGGVEPSVDDEFLGLRFLREIRDDGISLPVVIFSVVAAYQLDKAELRRLDATHLQKLKVTTRDIQNHVHKRLHLR